MGWSASLKSNKEITFNEVENIVNQLPKYLLLCGFQPHLNEWGWNAATDILKPEYNEIGISGSYGISGEKAKVMAEYLKEKLEDNGHEIEIEYCW